MITIDQQIEDALDAGDVETAAMLAAKLPKPQEYRDAMIRVNAIVTNGMKQETAVLEFKNTTMWSQTGTHAS